MKSAGTKSVLQITIRPESDDDQESIRQVNRLAFQREDEARLVDSLRAGQHVRHSLVAVNDKEIVGHILFSGVAIISGNERRDALALAPLAVKPDFQFQGIGSLLVRQGLGGCREAGDTIVFVLGYPPYYQRFGFSSGLAARLESPYAGPAFMALELVHGALNTLKGRVEYPAPFQPH